MKIILFFLATAITALSADEVGINIDLLAAVLRLEGTELKIENVTERESVARDLPLRSAWIVSAPGHDLFFPLVIYTSRKGVINSSKFNALKMEIRNNPPKEGDFGYGMGFFDVNGIGECLVMMEEFGISSNRPPDSKEVRRPWWPIRESGMSIIGTLEKEEMDFGIFLPFLDEDKIGGFPEFKSMLYGPDFPNVKDLSNALVTIVRDSKILERDEAREDKQRRSKLADDNVPEGKTNALVEGKFQPLEDNASIRPDTAKGKQWLWMAIIVVFFLAVGLLWIRKNQ